MTRVATITWPDEEGGIWWNFEAKVDGQTYRLLHRGPMEGYRLKDASKVDLREELAKSLNEFARYIRNSARVTDEEVRRAKDSSWGPPEG